MDFKLTDEQELIVDSYREYMESENWETYFHECDEKHVYPLRWVAGLCELGFDQIMLPAISEPRKEVSKYAPKMLTMHIDPSKIREVIGSGGKVIQKIVADTAPRSTSTTTAPSSSPAWTPPAATPPRSASTISCSSPRSASCTTAAWCA